MLSPPLLNSTYNTPQTSSCGFCPCHSQHLSSSSTSHQCYQFGLIANLESLLVGGLMLVAIIVLWLTSSNSTLTTTGWTITGSMIYGRYYHTSSLLTNGKVLVAGGMGSSRYLNSTELYDPSTDVWTVTSSMSYT
ncbi:unnamed protein product [Rotaria socialis]|uniref:Uncharacterized protein n=1 Tax=Rotaria socialis TaxID=392032 RepID=A0A820GS69_9BILA|nr:unnamed protein product [Rotaria socialis]